LEAKDESRASAFKAPTFEERKVVSLFAVLTYLVLFLCGLYILFSLRSLIPPFLVATLIAITLINEVDRMERNGWRRGVAIAVIYLLFLVIAALIVRGINALVTGDLLTLIKSVIPRELIEGKQEEFVVATSNWMKLHHFPKILHTSLLDQAKHLPQVVGMMTRWFTENIPALAASLMWLVLVPILAFFLLLDFHRIIGKIFILVPRQRREGLLTVVTEIVAILGNYVRGILLVMIMDMLVIYIVLQFARMGQYAFVLAVVAGLLYTIPYLGAVVSTLMIALTAFAVTHEVGHALAVTGVMIFIHQIVFDNIVAPRVIGKSVNMHPLLTLVSLLAAGTVFGVWGVLLGIPVTAALQVIVVHIFPQLQTDEVVMCKAENAVKATLSAESEQTKPELRKSGDEKTLDTEEVAARHEATEAVAESQPSRS